MYLRKSNRSRRQRGMALITSILVVSLATITATSMLTDQHIFSRRTENILHHEQAYLYLLGAEDWAKHVLARDFNDNQTDSRKDDWATVLPAIPVEGGSVGGVIEDLHGRFNINNLADPGNAAALEAFRELLALYKLPGGLENAVLDWLDADQQARFPDGAEDVDYMQGERAYRAGNGLMASVSELLYIKGFDYNIYEVLAPALIALPTSSTTINVNTASPIVLRMIVKGLTEQEAEQLAKDLADKPVKDISEFLNNSLVTGKPVATTGVDVSSSYFMIHAYATIGRARANLDSLVHRIAANNVKTLQRSQGGV